MIRFIFSSGFLLVILFAAITGDPRTGGTALTRAIFGPTASSGPRTVPVVDNSDRGISALAMAQRGQRPAAHETAMVSAPSALTRGPDASIPDPQIARAEDIRRNISCRLNLFGGQMPELTASRHEASQVLCWNAFAVQTNPVDKTPLWTAHRLTPEGIANARGTFRTGEFYEDPRVNPIAQAQLSDYRGSGFDRGHMVPSGDMGMPETQQETFALANIVPQDPTGNRCFWSDVEMSIRNYVARAKTEVFVITFPMSRSLNPRRIGRGVTVPSHLLKAVYEPSSGRSIVIMAENVADPNWTFATAANLKRATGIDLFPAASGNAGLLDIDPRQARPRSGCPSRRAPHSS